MDPNGPVVFRDESGSSKTKSTPKQSSFRKRVIHGAVAHLLSLLPSFSTIHTKKTLDMFVCCLLDVFQSPKISLVASILGRELVSGAVGTRHLSRSSWTNKSLEIAEPLKCHIPRFQSMLKVPQYTFLQYFSDFHRVQVIWRVRRLKEYTKSHSNKILPCCRCYQGWIHCQYVVIVLSVFLRLCHRVGFTKFRSRRVRETEEDPLVDGVRRQLLKLSVSYKK